VLGLQKLVVVGERRVRLALEHVDTAEAPVVNAPLGTPVFYTHPAGTFYAHDGQPLGAGIGPSGESQRLDVDVLQKRSGAGLFAARRIRNLRAFYDSYARLKGRDLELAVGGRVLLSRGGLDLDLQAGVARRWNAEFLGDLWQPSLRATATWWPGR
jgi:hypothetical protein